MQSVNTVSNASLALGYLASLEQSAFTILYPEAPLLSPGTNGYPEALSLSPVALPGPESGNYPEALSLSPVVPTAPAGEFVLDEDVMLPEIPVSTTESSREDKRSTRPNTARSRRTRQSCRVLPSSGPGGDCPKKHSPSSSSRSSGRSVRPVRQKKNKDHFKRQSNAWILYRGDKLREMKAQGTSPDATFPRLGVAAWNQRIAAVWKVESQAVREHYFARVEELK